MNFRLIAYLVSALVFFLGLSMCLPLIIGLIYNDNGAWPLFLSLAVTSGVGGCVLLPGPAVIKTFI